MALPTELTDSPPIWERLPKEASKSYEYFKHYRDQGSHRLIQATAKHFKKSYTHLRAVSSRNNWAERVRAYELHLERVEFEAKKKVIQDMSERHAKSAAAISGMLMLPVNALGERLKNMPQETKRLEEVSTEKLIRMVVDSARVMPAIVNTERISRGEPTIVTQNDTSTTITDKRIDLSKLTDEELQQIEAILSKHSSDEEGIGT